MEEIAKIKQIRQMMDVMAREMKSTAIPAGVEIVQQGEHFPAIVNNYDEALKSILLARMWSGKMLASLGAANPYPESTNKNLIVEPTADQATINVDPRIMTYDDVILMCKEMRNACDMLNDDIGAISGVNNTIHVTVIRHVQECKMWLGMLMSEMNEEKLAKNLVNNA